VLCASLGRTNGSQDCRLHSQKPRKRRPPAKTAVVGSGCISGGGGCRHVLEGGVSSSLHALEGTVTRTILIASGLHRRVYKQSGHPASASIMQAAYYTHLSSCACPLMLRVTLPSCALVQPTLKWSRGGSAGSLCHVLTACADCALERMHRRAVLARTGTSSNVEDLKHFMLECPVYDDLRAACPAFPLMYSSQLPY
jgi:hypothetical protein